MNKKKCFKKNNVYHLKWSIFAILLSRRIQSPITQKLREGDQKFSTLFKADEFASVTP